MHLIKATDGINKVSAAVDVNKETLQLAPEFLRDRLRAQKHKHEDHKPSFLVSIFCRASEPEGDILEMDTRNFGL